ncbi:MAG: hypothetical protein EOM14_13965, partial [Clostridia bacterium]|nr:hypothetical protein [Clostridia bacterium]
MILSFIGAMTSTDVSILFIAVPTLSIIATALQKHGLSRFAFIPVLLLLAVVSYAVSALLSLGTFTWSSDTYILLQVFGLCWVISLFLFLYTLTGSMPATVITGGILTIIFGIANYAMVQFRGRMFLIGDVTALRTAVNVAGTYSLEVSSVFVLAIVTEIIFCTLAVFSSRVSDPRPSFRWRLASRIALLIPVSVYVISISGGLMNACGIRLTWN